MSVDSTVNKIASDFQSEILEDNSLRNEEIQRLQNLETTCMDLLNQANVTISDLCSKKGESFDKYEKMIGEVAIWQKYQQALTEDLTNIIPLNHINKSMKATNLLIKLRVCGTINMRKSICKAGEVVARLRK